MALAQELVDLVSCSSCVTGPDPHRGEASWRAASHLWQEQNPLHQPWISQSEWTHALNGGSSCPAFTYSTLTVRDTKADNRKY